MASEFQPLYILASGLFFQQRKLEKISNNLANIDTNGFKRELITAQAYYVKEENPPKLNQINSPQRAENNFVYPIIGKSKVDLSPGELIKTDNPLDLAIEGEGFFSVEVNGKTYYTRDGHFLVDRNGYLVNQNGFPVLGEGGKIYIGRKPLSSVRVTRDGIVYVGTNRVAKLKIVALKEIKKFGNNLFEGKEIKTKNYTVLQGYLEGSNVNPVEEMVRMIETIRAYETFANGLKAEDENNNKLINNTLRA